MAFYSLPQENMEKTLTPNTQEQVKNLVKSVSKSELIEFILNADSSYSTATAESFLEYLKNKETSGDVFYKGYYFEFVRGVLGYSMLNYGYDFRRIATEKMESYKSIKKDQAKKDAEKYREETRKANFEKVLIEFYLWKAEEKDVKMVIFWTETPYESQYKRNDGRKTYNKILKKMETKSHDFNKIIKLINDDMARGYADYVKLTDEQEKHAERIAKSHWFVERY